MSGENCLSFNWYSSRTPPKISFFRVPTKYDEYSIKTGEKILLQLLLVIPYVDESNLNRQIKNQTFWVALSSKKTWSVVSKLFLLNCIFYYIGNWSKVLEFYLTSFFNMKSWRVKFINFLGDQEWVMDFHTFFRCFTSNTHSWYTSNFKSFIGVAVFFLM